MQKRGKKYKAQLAMFDGTKKYSIDEAVAILKKFAGARKFDQTIRVAINLGIDASRGDQLIRGAISLPHTAGKKKRVIVFADGDEAGRAREAGAAEVGMEDLAKKISEGWDDFDVAIAIQRAMPLVGKLGRVLGPKGKMPNPKTGTVVPATGDVATTVREFVAGKVEFKNDKDGNLQVPIGKVSMGEDQIKENLSKFIDHIKAMRPQTVKGYFVRSCSVSLDMSPSVRLNIAPA